MDPRWILEVLQWKSYIVLKMQFYTKLIFLGQVILKYVYQTFRKPEIIYFSQVYQTPFQNMCKYRPRVQTKDQ